MARTPFSRSFSSICEEADADLSIATGASSPSPVEDAGTEGAGTADEGAIGAAMGVVLLLPNLGNANRFSGFILLPRFRIESTADSAGVLTAVWASGLAGTAAVVAVLVVEVDVVFPSLEDAV